MLAKREMRDWEWKENMKMRVERENRKEDKREEKTRKTDMIWK